jgi:hypothetical protein
MAGRQVFQGEIGVGRFDDDLVRADAGEAVVESDRGGFERPSTRMAG